MTSSFLCVGVLTLGVQQGGVLLEEERVLVDRHGAALGRGLHAGAWFREGLWERRDREHLLRLTHETGQITF